MLVGALVIIGLCASLVAGGSLAAGAVAGVAAIFIAILEFFGINNNDI